jgi:hypothetical protein
MGEKLACIIVCAVLKEKVKKKKYWKQKREREINVIFFF